MDNTAQSLNQEIQKLEKEIEASKLPPELHEKAKSMLEVLKISLHEAGHLEI